MQRPYVFKIVYASSFRCSKGRCERSGKSLDRASTFRQSELANRAVKCHLLAVFRVTKLVEESGFVRFNNLKVTCWDHTIACDNRKTRRHLMVPILFIV